jgi:hypothetical protein
LRGSEQNRLEQTLSLEPDAAVVAAGVADASERHWLFRNSVQFMPSSDPAVLLLAAAAA